MNLDETKQKYLSTQLIAYIGNKRALLGLIEQALRSTQIQTGGFLDLFAGSGSVSRLAKTLGFSVYSNDWEFYSYVINEAYLKINDEDLSRMFITKGGILQVLHTLNSLKIPNEPYIAKYYAPISENPDPSKERMFYSRENALKIDAIREKIEEWYPEWNDEKFLLVALLLYEAATHTNTSGVFKAYHHGFGGYGKDALSRILGSIVLELPALYPKLAHEYKVFRKDANLLVKELDWSKIQITYLDPPYNQHQYGSNYHLLNTIAHWDKPLISNDFRVSGKAAIRKDWIKTRSNYCYQEKAKKSFAELIEAIQSRFTFISYNTEGIIPFQYMVDLLKKYGRVSLFTDKYVKYKGGRQSLQRKVNNLEFLIVLEKEKPHQLQDSHAMDEILMQKKLEVFFNCPIAFEQLKKLGWKTCENGFEKDGKRIEVKQVFFKGCSGDLNEIYSDLKKCIINNKEEEIRLLFSLDSAAYRLKILNAFKKIVHKKYQMEFNRVYDLISKTYEEDKLFKKIMESAMKRGVF